MRFLIDAQLPPSLVPLLREAGHEAEHISDRLPQDAPDQRIWLRALNEERVLVTKDEDFAGWSRLRDPAPRIVWIRLGNLKKSKLREKLMPLLPEIVRRLESGEGLVEVG
jgi:predicted nuclease of predicted toxin-antitoxin system